MFSRVSRNALLGLPDEDEEKEALVQKGDWRLSWLLVLWIPHSHHSHIQQAHWSPHPASPLICPKFRRDQFRFRWQLTLPPALGNNGNPGSKWFFYPLCLVKIFSGLWGGNPYCVWLSSVSLFAIMGCVCNLGDGKLAASRSTARVSRPAALSGSRATLSSSSLSNLIAHPKAQADRPIQPHLVSPSFQMLRK